MNLQTTTLQGTIERHYLLLAGAALAITQTADVVTSYLCFRAGPAIEESTQLLVNLHGLGGFAAVAALKVALIPALLVTGLLLCRGLFREAALHRLLTWTVAIVGSGYCAYAAHVNVHLLGMVGYYQSLP